MKARFNRSAMPMPAEPVTAMETGSVVSESAFAIRCSSSAAFSAVLPKWRS